MCLSLTVIAFAYYLAICMVFFSLFYLNTFNLNIGIFLFISIKSDCKELICLQSLFIFLLIIARVIYLECKVLFLNDFAFAY